MPDEWTENELLIAMEFYYACPERMHTDAHEKCVQIARMLGRTPGALDRIIRNIKYADTGGTGLEHASALIHRLVSQNQNNVAGIFAQAQQIRATNGWPALDCNE